MSNKPTPNDLNWREHILQALKEGHLTTVITFDNTKYLVTLQPYTEQGEPVDRALCTVCGQVALRRAEDSRWYHADPKDGNHAAHVQGWTPADPKKAWQHARCICGANLTWLVGKKQWAHTQGEAIGHVPTPDSRKHLEAIAEAATPVRKGQK